MKTLCQFFVLTMLLVGAVVLQDLLPFFSFFRQIHVMLLPLVFCFGALVLPFSGALFFALLAGILQGLVILQFSGNSVEIGLGWFIFFFITSAFILQWLSELAGGVRWELHAIGSALCTIVLLLGEFLLLSIKRGDFVMTGTTICFLLIPPAVVFLIAPLFYYLFQFLLPPRGSAPVMG